MSEDEVHEEPAEFGPVNFQFFPRNRCIFDVYLCSRLLLDYIEWVLHCPKERGHSNHYKS